MSTIESLHAILDAYGTTPDQLEPQETYRIEVPGFDDLVIEKLADDRMSVGHYYVQRGDLMSDPEVVFKITRDGLVPVCYTPPVHPRIR